MSADVILSARNIVNASAALIGFTGATGAGIADQRISNFSYKGGPAPFHWSTADGTASSTGAAADYQAASGHVPIPAQSLTGTISVVINGDKTKEANETFFVNLTGAVNATILDGQGLGTILNDD